MEHRNSDHTDSPRIPARIEKELLLSISALGTTSIITQIILLREFLSVFYGNELVIGVILANWMALTGAGAFLGRHSVRLIKRTNFIVVSLILMAVLPAASVFLLYFLRNIVFPAGSMPGLLQILWSSFILLLPFCLLSGFLFTYYATHVSKKHGTNLIATIYFIESLGSVAGGLAFNLVLLYFFKTFQILAVLMALNLSAAAVYSVRQGSRTRRALLAVVSILILIIPGYLYLDDIAKGLLFKDQKVLFYKDTPYGSLTVTRQADQQNYYENSMLLFSTDDIEQKEEAVHYAMIQHPNPQKVLLISGGLSGATDEILKYGLSTIAYVEINPWLITLGKEYGAALSDKRIKVINRDARLFIKEADERYDVVLINVSDPGTAQLNRYYTVEFMQDLRKKLNRGAVLSLGLLSSADYWGEEALQISSVMYNTLKANFRNVLIVPGTKNYFLASDADLSIHISEMLNKRGIENLYVNRHFIDDRILKERSGELMRNLDRNAALNTDFKPVSYYRQLRFWLSSYRFNYGILLGLVLLVLLLAARKFNAVSFGMFAGGFAGTSIEVIILLGFQVIYGHVYQTTGLIITVFMAGLAAGSLFGQRVLCRADYKKYITLQVFIGVYSAMLPFVLMALKAVTLPSLIIHLVFLALAFLIALLVGMEFSLASRLRGNDYSSASSELYGLDLLGSAIGALILTTYLIPLAGILTACSIISILSLAGGLVTYAGRHKLAA